MFGNLSLGASLQGREAKVHENVDRSVGLITRPITQFGIWPPQSKQAGLVALTSLVIS